MTADRLYDIALPLLPNVGVIGARLLLDLFGSSKEIFTASPSDFLNKTELSKEAVSRLIHSRDAALKRAEQELNFVEKHRLNTWAWSDDDYPESLRMMHDAPVILYGKGNISFGGKFLSVVGTRDCTDRGKQLCHNIVRDLAAAVPNLTIVSGLAYGIDIEAHKAALEAGIPTIALLAHGLDRIYPAMHRQIAVQMLGNGGLMTEYMSGTSPERQNFLFRNRIVAGISQAVLVVESKARGGSLNTAHTAFSYSRDVLACPGRPTDINSAGCNTLIHRQFASLVTSAADIIDTLGWQSEQVDTQLPLFHDDSNTVSFASYSTSLSPAEKEIIKALQPYEDGASVNDIVEISGISFAEVSSLLFGLEMQGVVRSLAGSAYRLAK